MITAADISIYRVDFNTVDPETWQVLGTADSVLHTQPVQPHPGDPVVLMDAEGNRCRALIASVDGDLLRFDLNEGTWSSSPEQVQLANTSRQLT
jgi:hypothetical protein